MKRNRSRGSEYYQQIDFSLSLWMIQKSTFTNLEYLAGHADKCTFKDFVKAMKLYFLKETWCPFQKAKRLRFIFGLTFHQQLFLIWVIDQSFPIWILKSTTLIIFLFQDPQYGFQAFLACPFVRFLLWACRFHLPYSSKFIKAHQLFHQLSKSQALCHHLRLKGDPQGKLRFMHRVGIFFHCLNHWTFTRNCRLVHLENQHYDLSKFFLTLQLFDVCNTNQLPNLCLFSQARPFLIIVGWLYHLIHLVMQLAQSLYLFTWEVKFCTYRPKPYPVQ